MEDKLKKQYTTKDETKESFDVFWDVIEARTGSKIPSFIRNILNFHGFNCALSVSLLEDGDLDKIEKFVKASKGLECVKQNAEDNIIERFGPFKTAEEFCFPIGYRKVLLRIAAFIQEKGAENVLNANIFQGSSSRVNRKGPAMQRSTTENSMNSVYDPFSRFRLTISYFS